MPRTEDENKRIRESQRASILEAAKGVFAGKGWETTMADIAAAAGISQGLIYHYFESKAAVFSELMREMLQSDSFRISETLPEKGTPAERLEALISGLLQCRQEPIANFAIAMQAADPRHSTAQYMRLMRRMFENMPGGHPGIHNLKDFMMHRFRTLGKVIADIIAEGQETGEFAKDDPEKLTMMILSMVQGMTKLALHQPEEYRIYYPYTAVIMRMVKQDAKPSEAEGE
jgi:AcrR family transcriptional regulator